MNLRTLFLRAPATAAITAVCVLIYIITAIQARSFSDSVWGSSLGISMVLYGPFVTDESWGWLRLVTAGFLHLDITHLFVNMLMLIFVGGEVERFVGTARFLFIWFVGGICASGAVLLMNYDVPTAGASGSLFAVLAVLVAIAYRRSTDLRAAITLVVINLLFTFVGANVSVWGHLGGVLAGAILAWPITAPRRVR